MTAKTSLPADALLLRVPHLDALREATRYLAASAAALLADAGTYMALIRLAGVDYLVAAPLAFLLGLLVVYLLSTRWVFARRRLSDPWLEFAIFASIGVVGLGLNQLIIYACVERLALSYEIAKLASVAWVFAFNFGARKLLLFSKSS